MDEYPVVRPDAIFNEPRLARIYDVLDGARDDLDLYVEIAERLCATKVIDVGCGTGSLPVILAAKGIEVIGTDPAAASIDVARRKTGAASVRWEVTDGSRLPKSAADLVTLTGNAAQAIVDEELWSSTLRSIHGALQPRGHLVFETRDPAAKAWLGWNRADTETVTAVETEGTVRTFTELLTVAPPLVSFRHVWIFESDGSTMTSESTLRFRDREELHQDLENHGFDVVDVRDAPDRPGKELVFIAQRR